MNTSTQLHEIPVDRIIPDPNQPRKTANEADIKDYVLQIAAQIKTEGLINAIEVSCLTEDTYMIVTGEIRWRATKYLIKNKEISETTIKASILDIEKEGLKRFRRQVIENLTRRGSMGVWETALAFAKLLNLTSETFKQTEMAEIRTKYNDEIKQLAIDTGKSRQWILECIGYLQEPDDIKTYIQSTDGRAAVVRGLNVILKRESVSDEHKQIIKAKILERDITDRDVVLRLGNEIQAHPEKAHLLLAESYKSGRTKNMKKMDEIIERRVIDESENAEEQANRNAKDLSLDLQNFALQLKGFPIRDVSRNHLEGLFEQVALFKRTFDSLYNILAKILNQPQLPTYTNHQQLSEGGELYERT